MKIKRIVASALAAIMAGMTLASCSQQGTMEIPFVDEGLKNKYTSVVEGSALTLYVDGSVSESGDGSKMSPFKTIAEAQAAIRSLKAGEGLPIGGVTVLVKDGEYYLSETLNFTAEDSGTAESPVTYAAESEFGAVLTG